MTTTTLNDAAIAPRRPSKPAAITGWVITGLLVLMFGAGGIYTIFNPRMMNEGLAQQGFPPSAGKVLIAIEIVCAVLYAIPRTAMLGAILFTGFFGGAVCVHVRLNDGMWFIPAIFGVLTWLALYLRDLRVRALIPLRQPTPRHA
jgi:hypothetical protein